jgi:hypothetical protein
MVLEQRKHGVFFVRSKKGLMIGRPRETPSSVLASAREAGTIRADAIHP